MPTLDSQINEIAARHGLSAASAAQLVEGLLRSQGSQVQFNIPEFGGMGQWMPGMVMAGNMFDTLLKALVDAACTDISRLVREGSFSPASTSDGHGSGNWWPEELGTPTTSGGQNDVRYAWFPTTRRLAINENGDVSIYDTEDHLISGVSQQQSGVVRTLMFTSQIGMVTVSKLRRI